MDSDLCMDYLRSHKSQEWQNSFSLLPMFTCTATILKSGWNQGWWGFLDFLSLKWGHTWKFFFRTWNFWIPTSSGMLHFFFNVFSFFNISICIIFKYDINLCADALIYYWNGSKKPPRLYTLAHLHWSVCLGDITNIERCKTSWNNTKAWLTADVTLLLAFTTVCDSDNSRYNRSLRHQKTSNSVPFKFHRRKDDSSDQATVTNLLNFGENVAIIAFVFCS